MFKTAGQLKKSVAGASPISGVNYVSERNHVKEKYILREIVHTSNWFLHTQMCGCVHFTAVILCLMTLLPTQLRSFVFNNFTLSVPTAVHVDPNRLLLLAGNRKRQPPVRITSSHSHVEWSLQDVKRYAVAPHFINHTHFSVVLAVEPFETSRWISSIPAIVNIEIKQVIYYPVTGVDTTCHHDARFDTLSQTFFIIDRFWDPKNRGKWDRIYRVALNGTILWDWSLHDDPEAPSCKQMDVSCRKACDCTHTNSLQYDAERDMLYLSMRRAGLLALQVSTKRIMWVWTWTSWTPRMRIAVCPNASTVPWPTHQPHGHFGCFGTHGLQRVSDGTFWVFFNPDSSGRGFRIHEDRRCLEPTVYVRSHVARCRGHEGFVYPIPNGIALGSAEDKVEFFQDSDQVPRVEKLPYDLWLDPVFSAPYLRIVLANTVTIRLQMAHHLWVPYIVQATVSCMSFRSNMSGPGKIFIAPQQVTLAAFMAVTNHDKVLSPADVPLTLKCELDVGYVTNTQELNLLP